MKLLRCYDAKMYAGSLIPPHGITDVEKFEKIVKSMRKGGWRGRPLVVVGEEGMNLYRSLTGSHRIAAAGVVEMPIPCRVLYFDCIGWKDSKIVMSWKDGYFHLPKWIRKFDKETAKIFRSDLHRSR